MSKFELLLQTRVRLLPREPGPDERAGEEDDQLEHPEDEAVLGGGGALPLGLPGVEGRLQGHADGLAHLGHGESEEGADLKGEKKLRVPLSVHGKFA